jgi:mannosyltransferase OCH1-like enzyme
LNRWKNYFSQLLNVEIHTTELLVPDPSYSEVENAIGNLKICKLPSSDQILAELFQAGDETLQPQIHKLINFIWNKEELPDQWKESIVVPIYKKGDTTYCGNYRGISLHTKFYLIFFSQG